MLLTIQYLEDSPELDQLSAEFVAEKLREAGQILPITHVLIGWRLPVKLLEVCREETRRMKAKLYRWHPLLTGDGEFIPRPEWQVVGLNENRVGGFKNMPEFTFTCPNHPAVEYAVLDHLAVIASSGIYDGIFLDRVRFPSPAGAPLNDFGCFCEFCQEKAGNQGLDLNEVRSELLSWQGTLEGKKTFIRSFFPPKNPPLGELSQIERFFLFRNASVTRLVKMVAEKTRKNGLPVALDCFSPGLTRMVGQDLGALGHGVEWIKVMSYAHTNGPAGLPFEILGLLEYLIATPGMPEKEAIRFLGEAMGILLPSSREELCYKGLPSQALRAETVRGVLASSAPILTGIELVEIPGVAELRDTQITDDIESILEVSPAGLSISWDLLQISSKRLKLFAKNFSANSTGRPKC